MSSLVVFALDEVVGLPVVLSSHTGLPRRRRSVKHLDALVPRHGPSASFDMMTTGVCSNSKREQRRVANVGLRLSQASVPPMRLWACYRNRCSRPIPSGCRRSRGHVHDGALAQAAAYMLVWVMSRPPGSRPSSGPDADVAPSTQLFFSSTPEFTYSTAEGPVKGARKTHKDTDNLCHGRASG
jgi:hypothetical protein